MTLTEFLLARLAEDEGEADRVHDIDCDVHRGFADERGDCNCGEPGRILAEVEATRQIVHVLSSREQVDDSEEGLWHKIGYDRAAFDVLRLIAQPDADHEDYDPSWTPS